MRRPTVAAVVGLAALAAAFVLAASGCDQLHRPVGTPSSASTASGSADGEGSVSSGDGGVAPAPSITAQPGDTHL
ncbi:MAG TPA: hypothetical protein VM580_04475 [Labilithrix sp.]|nr:hypothetical protein [Labilithrix sp.]